MKQFPVLFTRIIIILSLFFVALPVTPVQAASIVVTNNSDSGAGSLRQAISDAADGSTISFNDDYTITLISKIPISKNLAITGAGHNVTISGGGTTGMFGVSGANVTFSLDHLTLTNGAADATTCAKGVNFCGGVVSVGRDAGLSISNSTLSNNKANDGGSGGDGGAIYSDSGNLSISNSTFSGNYSTSGGAIWQSLGTLNIKNSTFYNNSVSGYGGAIVMLVGYYTSSLTLKNNTFAGNYAPGSNGGALEITGSALAFTLLATNNIIANSTGGGNCKTIQSLNSSNLTDDSTCGSTSTVSSSILLGSLGNYGGETQTIPLLPGSSAINAGTADASVTTDQRGVARAQLSAYDVGAFESQGFNLVADSGDNQGAVVSSAFAQPLVAKVTAINPLEPVAGGKITFASPSSGASACLGSSATPAVSNTLIATIDSSGHATAYATANATTGSYSVTASINKPVLTTAFNLANGLPLTVTINQSGSSDPTKTNPINFDVVFSRAVTDLKSSNITLSGTASDAVVSGITGSDAAYVVSVTGISSGTVNATIPAEAVSDSVGIKNYVSTSTDNSVTYDGTAPETTISTAPGNPVNTTDASISFSGTDDTNGTGIASYQCKLDSGDYASCTSSKAYSSLSDGSHTFTVYASDMVGNDDPSPATYTWVVDTSSPSTNITAKPSDPGNSASASFTFAGDDGSGSGIAGYQCKLDSADYASCTSPKTYSSLSDGSHTFMVYATDLAGNSESTPISYTWVVDTSAPSTSITAEPSDPSTNSSVSFSFSGDDDSGSGVAGYQCKLDSGNYVSCTSPKDYSSLSDGSHSFMVYAVDAAGNSDSSPASYTWIVDSTAPITGITAKPSDPSASASASFSFSGNDGSGSGVAGYQCKLDSGDYGSCTSPKDYSSLSDGSHTFTVSAADLAGNSETPVSYTWIVDTSAPSTSITAKPSDPSTSSSASFSFSGDDGSGSGIAGYQCKLDSGDYASCTSPQTYSSLSDGSHPFTVYASDAAGNNDPLPATYTWVVDTSAPNTNITTKPSDPSASSDASFSFSGDDGSGSGVAGYQCKLDSGNYASCTSPKAYSSLSDGSHTFTVYATDTAGNDDPSPATYTWVVDTSAPSTSITAKPSDPSTSSSATFSFSGNDGSGTGVAGYQCKLDSGDYGSCSSPKTYSSLSDGSHTFIVFAADMAGNSETSPVSYIWVVDTSAPSTSITAKPSDPSTSSSASFSFSGDDGSGTGVAGYQCKLDSGDYASCSSSKTYSGLSDGNHTFMVYAVDAAGNDDPSPDSSTWLIDTVNPTITMTSAATDTTNVSPIPVTVTSSEPLIGFSVEDIIVTNGIVSNFIAVDSKNYTFDLNPAGQGVVTANVPNGAAVDAANLPSTAAHLSRTYDSIRPAVTIDQTVGQNDPTSSNSILFTVVFSENVTGFSTSDVTISGTASGASVTDISGSGSTYTLTVSGMTATGTVIASIDTGLVTDSAGNSNLASTSTDNSVSYILSATAATKDATEISSSTAVLNGTINSLGEDVAVSFEFGLDGTADTTIVSADPATVPGTTSTDVDVKYSLTNLKSNTTYRFRVIAINVVGSTYGDYLKFTTLDANITLEIHNTTHAPLPFAAINDNLHAYATVNGKGSTNIPSGSVIFYSYPNLICSGVSWSEETVDLDGSGTADMSSTVPLLANGLSFKAHYSGDSNYPATDSECTAISTSKYPTLLTLSSNNNPADGASLEGSTSQIKLQFNMDLLHDSDSDGNSVTNPGNYLLVEQGQNAAIDTQSCAVGVAGDDIKIKVNSVNFDSTTYIATVNVNDGTQLPIGVYRIYVCGTTSVSNPDKTVYLNNHFADSNLNFSVASITISNSTSTVSSAPQIDTGFAPGIKTVLGKQPSKKAYAEKDIWIEIPALEIKENVVGVPQSKEGWDVSWLGDKIGYLEGTTYPTWPGNSILTGHVSNSNGLPGVFANLGTLNWGKQIIIHTSGQTYTYEVRSVNTIAAKELSSVITKQDKYTWLTLITCKGYDEKSGSYPWRTVVRAILVSVKDE
jgi:LPXTG-site transpeptidase (sortase) family protein